MRDEVDFLPADKNKCSLQDDIVSLCVCITRYSKSTQNNKFAIYLQYLKENVMDEIDFLPGFFNLRLSF